MGIDGLLKLLDPIVLKEHLSTFRNQTAAIDIMSWLYKGCYRCAYEHNQNIETNAFLYYIFEMLQILGYYQIKPIVVFDGRYVGKKGETIEKRKKQKEENRVKGMEFLQQGNEEEAKKYLSRCIIIDDRIITLTMRALFTKGINYLVAPYESDSQIAKLIHLGIADFAITEDSDLLMYNVKAMLKLTQDGQCDFVDLSRWKPSDVDVSYLKVYLNMDPVERVEIGVLAGSDYNSSIKGIGIKRAIKHLSQRKTINAVIAHLRNKKNYQNVIPQNYESIVLDSKLIFIFATVYNPLTSTLQFFNPNLIDQIKPQHMQLQQLKKIVGPFYEYNEDTKIGKVNVRNLQPRQIFKIDIKEVFSANGYNLDVREAANIKRRQYVAAMRRKREEERANEPQADDADIFKRPSKPKKDKPLKPYVEVSAQQRKINEEQRKKLAQERAADKKQKFSQFKNMLNSFVLESSSDSQSSSSDNFNEPQRQTIDREPQNAQSNKKQVRTQPKIDKDQQSQSCSQSIDFQLQALNPGINPWAKI